MTGSILRVVRKDRGFTQVDNSTLRDDRLTFRARGVLAYLLSMKDGWRWDSTTLAEASPGEGRDAIRTALRELEANGYLRRTKHQDDAGHWVTVTEVHEAPGTDFQASVQPPTEDGSTGVGSSGPIEKTIEEDCFFVPNGTKLRKPRKRDPLWDALAEVCGIDTATLTASQRTDLGKTVKELREVGATPEDVRARARRWRGSSLTHRVLRQRWAELAPPRNVIHTTPDGHRYNLGPAQPTGRSVTITNPNGYRYNLAIGGV